MMCARVLCTFKIVQGSEGMFEVSAIRAVCRDVLQGRTCWHLLSGLTVSDLAEQGLVVLLVHEVAMAAACGFLPSKV